MHGADQAPPEPTEASMSTITTEPAPYLADEPYGPELPEEQADTAEASPLAAACAAGTVKLFRLRGTGTMRRLPWLAGEALETAEWYRLCVESGQSVRQVAEEAGVSKATVRRTLAALELMDSIEAGELDDLWDGSDELALGGFDDEAE